MSVSASFWCWLFLCTVLNQLYLIESFQLIQSFLKWQGVSHLKFLPQFFPTAKSSLQDDYISGSSGSQQSKPTTIQDQIFPQSQPHERYFHIIFTLIAFSHFLIIQAVSDSYFGLARWLQSIYTWLRYWR